MLLFLALSLGLLPVLERANPAVALENLGEVALVAETGFLGNVGDASPRGGDRPTGGVAPAG